MRHILEQAHVRLVIFAVALLGLTLILSGYAVIQTYAKRNLDLTARTIAYSVEPAIVFGDIDACKVDDLSGHRLGEIIAFPEGLHRVFCR